jgi:hypothetical protein
VAHIKEIQVFPMIQDADGSSRIINSTDKQDEKPDTYDVMVTVRDEDTHEHIEGHPDYQEFDDLTKDEAALLLYQLEQKHPDASSEWIEEDRPDWPSERGWFPLPNRTVADESTPPIASFDTLARSLPPLEFTQQKDRWDASQYEFTYEADFMRHKFVIEHLQPEDKWALFVDEPQVPRLSKDAASNTTLSLVDEQDHPTMQSALDSAERHRVSLLANSLGIEQKPTQEIIAEAATSEALRRDGHLVQTENDMKRIASSLREYATSSNLVSDPALEQLIKSHVERAQREIEEASALVARYAKALDEVAAKEQQAENSQDAGPSSSPSP